MSVKKEPTEERKERANDRLSLTLLFAFISFCTVFISMAAAVAIVRMLARLDVIINIPEESLPYFSGILIFTALIGLIIGTVFTILAGRVPLRPINRLITQMNRLASGDFAARLHFGKPIGLHPSFVELENSFNKMAEELQNTEMLRSDFINHFSHEFKTPIVSISGFAKLLKRGNLTEAQRAEYIDVIEEESMRLAYMATNVLNLTKVENQTILTDVTKFNVSEQIRSAVLLLENGWMKKNLDLSLEFSEYEIEANEELLKQVWINLVDNAVKFSPDYGPMEICIGETSDHLRISITNAGDIPAQAQQKIWNKFYQADESHSSVGNGIGLAIVKRIVTLHSGTAAVESKNGTVTFTVTLPKSQS